jgi:hypothetical protein
MAEDTPLRDDDFDDDKDRPRRRRRPRDDDSDDRPRKKAGGSNTGVIVGIVVGVLALSMCACVPIMIGLLLPAVQKVRESAARINSQNNMKIIGLAMFNQESATGSFQAPFAPGATNQDHSFRVGLLPYMEQNGLYKQIDLTQPWDSVKNAPLTGTPIKEFLDPANPTSVGTATPYRLFVGPGAMFDGTAKMPTLMSITDGTSNTIMAVSATQTVPWAKPQELPYGPGVALPPLGSTPTADGFTALMADGSVRYIRKTIPTADLRSLIEKADGRVVNIP